MVNNLLINVSKEKKKEEQNDESASYQTEVKEGIQLIVTPMV